MFNWIIQFKNANSKTKSFILTWVIYGVALVVTTIYCYARLDYVRSYSTENNSASND